MNLKDLVRDYVQQRNALLVDSRKHDAAQEFEIPRLTICMTSAERYNCVDALDYALGLLNQKDAEIARLKTELEQVDTVRNGWMGCQPEIARLKTELEQVDTVRNGWMGCQPEPARPVIPVPLDGGLGIGK